MLRVTPIVREHLGMATGLPRFVEKKGPFRRFCSRRWRNFKRRGAFLKAATVFGYSCLGVVTYAMVCCVAHLLLQPSIDRTFYQHNAEVNQQKLEFYKFKQKRKRSDGADTEDEDEDDEDEVMRELIAQGVRQEQAQSGSKNVFRHVTQKDFTLTTWEDIEETLQEGDVVLMRGEGWLSWGIVTTQFAYAFMRSPALYYSHAAVVVKPAEYKYAYELEEEAVQQERAARRWFGLPYTIARVWDGMRGRAPPPDTEASGVDGKMADKPGKAAMTVEDVLKQETRRLDSRKVKVRGAVILECMDNSEFHVKDVHGDVKIFAVQQVEAEKRLTSTRVSQTGGKDIHAYQYCAVRRLQDQERTPRFKEILQRFVERNEGRPVEENLFYPLAFFSPRFYLRVNPAREDKNIVCCGEMIAELFEELDLFERRWRWVRLTDGDGTSLSPEVDMQRSLASRVRIAVAEWIGPRPLTGDALVACEEADAKVRADLAQKGLPPPTNGDLHPTNAIAVPQLRVYERLHMRKEDEAQHPLSTRARPVAPPYTCIENHSVLADAELQAWSAMGCAGLSRQEMEAIAARVNEQRRVKAVADKAHNLVGLPPADTDPANTKGTLATGAVPLTSGMLVRTRDGGTAQLQHYYAHNTMETMPYSWTQTESARVFDWAMFKRPRWAMVRFDSTAEGRWRLKRAAQYARAATGSTSLRESPLPPQPEDMMVVDLEEDPLQLLPDLVEGKEDPSSPAAAAAARALEAARASFDEHPGPRLGEEVRMQRPHSGGF